MNFGFENGNKIAQETVEYHLIPTKDDKPSLEAILGAVFRLSGDYIWHDESFRLQQKDGPFPHFFGSTRFDDNLDDEWYIVFLLLELTKEVPGLVAKVEDSDGELLLIEAADVLPSWLSPETAGNRVFLYDGKLHIIPPASKIKDKNVSLPESIRKMEEGASLVAEFPQITEASPAIQTAIESKLSIFLPDKMKERWHHAHCLLPPRLALALSKQPKLVSPMVRAFYLRDPYDLKACREASIFGSEVANEGLVGVSVRFSRHLYAMLKKQQFLPDRRSPWVPPADPKLRNAFDLGVKLTCGCEILCKRVQDKGERNVSERDESRWKQFIRSLQTNGYFQNEIEGSQLYQRLLKDAKNFFNDSIQQQICQEPGSQVCDILTTVSVNDVQEFRATLDPFPVDEDDAWLNVTLEDLNEVLAGKEATFENGWRAEDADAEGSEESGEEEKSRAVGGKKKLVKKKMGQKVARFLDKESGKESKKKDGNVGFDEELSIPHLEDAGHSSSMDSYGEEDDLDEDAMREFEEMSRSLKQYMDQMDKELSTTSLAKSFVKTEPKPRVSSTRKQEKSKSPGADSIDLADDDFSPVDIDKNLVENMLRGYCEEKALGPGPSTSLIHGVQMEEKKKIVLDSDDESDPDIF